MACLSMFTSLFGLKSVMGFIESIPLKWWPLEPGWIGVPYISTTSAQLQDK